MRTFAHYLDSTGTYRTVLHGTRTRLIPTRVREHSTHQDTMMASFNSINVNNHRRWLFVFLLLGLLAAPSLSCPPASASRSSSKPDFSRISANVKAQVIVVKAQLLEEQGEYTKALEQLNKALRLVLETSGEDHANVAQVRANIGRVQLEIGDYETAIEEFEQSYRIYKLHSEEDDEERKQEMAEMLFTFGLVHLMQQNYDEAIQLWEESWAIHQSLMLSSERRYLNIMETAQVAEMLVTLSDLYLQKAKYDKSSETYQQALELFEQFMQIDGEYSTLKDLFPLSDPGVVSFAASDRAELNNMAMKVGDELGMVDLTSDEALQIYKDALAEFHSRLSIPMPGVEDGTMYDERLDAAYEGDLNFGIGAILFRRSELEDAEWYLNEALRIFRRTLKANDPSLAVCLWNLSNIYLRQGKFGKSRRAYNQALDIYRTSEVADNPLGEATTGDFQVVGFKIPNGDGSEPIAVDVVEYLRQSTNVTSMRGEL